MKVDRLQPLADGSHVRVQIDTDHEPVASHVAYQQSALWGAIRDEAAESFRRGVGYLYHDGCKVHDCRSVRDLAAATKRERASWGIDWREDRVH